MSAWGKACATSCATPCRFTPMPARGPVFACSTGGRSPAVVSDSSSLQRTATMSERLMEAMVTTFVLFPFVALPKCPKNSHFEQCGVACPATCEDPGAPSKCRAPCVEGCTCDKGFVRRGNQCVPESQCGCLYKPTGSYLAPGKSFWADENCRTKCTCDSGDGEVKCKASECPYEDARLTQCKVVKGIRGCYPVKYGKCSILGDPHYYTFDNRTYNFQGTCTYTAAKTCHTLVLRRNQIGKIMVSISTMLFKKLIVDGVLTNLPLNLNDGQIQAYQDGMQDVIITDFGLKVTYDLVYYVTVTVPSSYHGKTCGLCGNFNGNKDDDFQLPDGKETNDIKDFGAAWKVGVEGVVCDDGCSGDLCPKCDEKKKRIFESDCSIIRNPSGPFAACLNVIDPEPYFRDCVYDVCVGEGDRDMLCHSIASYVSDCQDFGVPIKNWRTPTFSLTCPAHSHYQVCAETCNTPCPGLTSVVSCPPTCAEGCPLISQPGKCKVKISFPLRTNII
uniref:VWFD domain-containing protein n=1 Tax=Denticeps clupeoides TaxID=299321 RepID=A0AAY4EYN3_9TELE